MLCQSPGPMLSPSLDRFSRSASRAVAASTVPRAASARVSGIGLLGASELAAAPQESTEALVLAVRAGLPRAEEALYTRFAPDVYRVVCRLLGSRDEASDIMQDTFVVVFEDLAKLRDPAAFRAWVLQIAVRLVYRRFRRRKLARLLGLDRSPQDSEDRIAWLLRHVEGFELAEVSEMMRCSLATAKRKLARAEHAIAVFRGDSTRENA